MVCVCICALVLIFVLVVWMCVCDAHVCVGFCVGLCVECLLRICLCGVNAMFVREFLCLNLDLLDCSGIVCVRAFVYLCDKQVQFVECQKR